MHFTVLIPARHHSTRLPGKMLADIGGLPMVVRVAQQAQRAGAKLVAVATDHEGIAAAVRAHGFQVCMTRVDHASGTDRLADAAAQLALGDEAIVVNVQGDEPLIEPSLIARVAQELQAHERAAMATLAYPIRSVQAFANPNVVKVVLDAVGNALYFSRASVPYARDALHAGAERPQGVVSGAERPQGVASDAEPPQGVVSGAAPSAPPQHALHHVGIYAYRAGFLRRFTQLAPSPLEQLEALEQLRALWHGYSIRVAVIEGAPAPGVDTAADLELVRRLFDQNAASR